MQAQIKSWGNSQGIRLTKDILQTAGFLPEDILTINAFKGQIVIKKEFQHRSLKERAADYNGKLNLSEEIDLGDPRGSEVW